MSKRIFNNEQTKELLQNPSVAGCSDKSICYRKEFKISSVKRYYEGFPVSEIFRQAGFNLDVIGRDTPKECLNRWRKVFKEKGEDGLKIDGRGKSKAGSRKKTNWSDDKEKIKYLEAEVAYLKAENDFLAKLRKKS